MAPEQILRAPSGAGAAILSVLCGIFRGLEAPVCANAHDSARAQHIERNICLDIITYMYVLSASVSILAQV